ncbi:MAG: polynucleotide adenylyltransferase PcnB [Gammaproteobacteria bacterium]|nr:polynucleotide adenylyltransferase PcnB [Gammaproteobacteria bacterium]MBP9728848.1 polynucleotide adenylyltransferase PcnB [Gammaproteobacteria bacterium]
MVFTKYSKKGSSLKRRLLGWFSRLSSQKKKALNKTLPHIVPRAAHCLSRSNIGAYALKVLYTLHNAGYQAYLVGGGVRDLLLEIHPKDFDVATDAKPEQIRALFRNCRLIGRRFRLAHVYFGGHIIEVATFRGHASLDEKNQVVHSKEGMILRDNIYGTLEDDVFRRDFTINALYYNIGDFSLVDYVGGLKDLNARCIRVIGNPSQRYREDPVRILRAIRFAAKLEFQIDPLSEAVIRQSGHWLQDIHEARLLDEYPKLFLMGFGYNSFVLLKQYALFEPLFPQSAQILKGEQGERVEDFIEHALKDTDQRVATHQSVTISFLIATFLWHAVEAVLDKLLNQGVKPPFAFEEACDQVLLLQHQHRALPKRLQQSIQAIWHFQGRLARRGKRSSQLCAHPAFRAGFDFLCLRAAHTTDAALKGLVEWWTSYLEASTPDRHLMIEGLKQNKAPYRRRKKKSV